MAKAAATKYYISIDYNKQSISIFGRSTCVVYVHHVPRCVKQMMILTLVILR